MEIRRLNTIRGLAAIIVLVSHFSNETYAWGKLFGDGAGQFGVMLFFVLSGFLMSLLYWEREPTTKNLLIFSVSRIARIVPLFFIVVIISFLFDYPYKIENVKKLISHLLFLSGESVLWTIPPEMQFYTIFAMSWYFFKSRNRMLLATVIMAFIFLFFNNFPDGSQIVFGLTISEALLKSLPYFIAGSLLARLYNWSKGVLPEAHGAYLFMMFLIPLLFPNIFFVVFGLSHGMWKDVGVLVMVVITFFSIVFLVPKKNIFIENVVGDFMGKISYSLYLLHMPVLSFTIGLNLNVNYFCQLIIFIALSIFVALVSYTLIENPTRLLLRKIVNPYIISGEVRSTIRS